MDCAREMGWDNPQASIHIVPVIRNGREILMNLIEEFGRYSIQELQDHVLTYYDPPIQQAQNGHMMYYYIIDTITVEVNIKVINKVKKYVINGINSSNYLH